MWLNEGCKRICGQIFQKKLVSNLDVLVRKKLVKAI